MIECPKELELLLELGSWPRLMKEEIISLAHPHQLLPSDQGKGWDVVWLAQGCKGEEVESY